MNKVDTVGTGWIGVDLDGTLAEYHGWQGHRHIGEPIPAMLERVKQWLADGKDVRIFTARVCPQQGAENLGIVVVAINEWCRKHFGRALPITCIKDYAMIELWDDRCVQVVPNTGIPIKETIKNVIEVNA